MRKSGLLIHIIFSIHLLLLLPLSLQAAAQQAGARQEAAPSAQEADVQEKVYVHTDRNLYLAGETLWFTAYVVAGPQHKSSQISRVAYLEVLNAANGAVLQAKIELKEGIGQGAFYLPMHLPSGTYKLLSYTQWMKNFSADYFYEKSLTLVNTHKDYLPAQAQAQQGLQLEFFPEGGYLVNSLPSKVGFKISDQWGRGLDLKGVVLGSAGDTLATFSPLKFGMGHFYLTPQAHETYKALLMAPDSSIYTFMMPPALEQGYVMQQMELVDRHLEVEVYSTHPQEWLYLISYRGRKPRLLAAQQSQEGYARFHIPADSLEAGINCYTLFNAMGQPLAERLYFREPKNKLNIAITSDSLHYGPRQKVNLGLLASGPADATVDAHLSVAVYKLDSLNTLPAENIFTYLWLGSALKGQIESPLFYFQENEPDAPKALDNLLLCQGWRKFFWQEEMSASAKALRFAPEYEGHLLEVQAAAADTGIPLAEAQFYLSIPGKRGQFYSAHSNASGRLRFVTDKLYEENNLLFYNAGASPDRYSLTLISPFADTFSNTPYLPFSLRKEVKESLRQRHVDMQVRNTFWKDKLNFVKAPELDSLPFFRHADKTYLLDDYTRFSSMEEVMREYVYEVRVRKQDNKFYLRVFNPFLGDFFSDKPLVLLDGVPFTDIDELMARNPLSIQKLDVVNDRYILDRNSIHHGVLSFTSYKGDQYSESVMKESVSLDYDALQLQRIFYSPSYDTGHSLAAQMPDFRNLLHWCPELRTNEEGNAGISFFTADTRGSFVVVVQGLSSTGAAGAGVYIFSVAEDAALTMEGE